MLGEKSIRAYLRPMEPLRDEAAYQQLWRIVDGAVRDALKMHPDYLTRKGWSGSAARRSIVKRVTGSVMGFVEQSTEGRVPRLKKSEPFSGRVLSTVAVTMSRGRAMVVRAVARLRHAFAEPA